MDRLKRVMARLLESYDLQSLPNGQEGYETSHAVAAILMNREDAEAVRDFLTGTGSYKEEG